MHELIDTHTHLYLPDFDEDRMEMVERAKSMQVKAILLPNIDAQTMGMMFQMVNQFPGLFFAMLGLHPCSVKENYKEELDHIFKNISTNKIVGIGEVGIDLYWDKTTIEKQSDALEVQLKWAKELKLPLSIHTREATLYTIKLIEKWQDGGIKGVFHCFGGTEEEAKRITDLGMYMGIGGVVTYKNSNLIELIRKIGIDRIVLETDAPYLSPVPYRGKRNESSYLSDIVHFMSEKLDYSFQQIAEITSQNARTVFLLEK